MRSKTIARSTFAVMLLLAVFLLSAAAASAGGSAAMYEIKIKNLTAHQILSPPVFVSHNKDYRLFKGRHFASKELRMIAEGGDTSAAVMRATYSRNVFDVQTAGPVLPGESVTVTVRAPKDSRLSLATMLVQTNDGFVGVNNRFLTGLNTRTWGLMARDAGTEANNEMAAYVPGPPFGGMLRDATHQRIRDHKGIRGGADIDPATYGWSGSVAKLTIKPLTP